MSGESPAVTVAVCTKDRPDSLVLTVESVLADDTFDFELIVIDQSAGNASELALQRFGSDRLRYVRTSTIGKGAGLQEAVRRAAAPYLAFTDDDCVVPRGWVEAITQPLREQPDVGLVFSSVTTPDYDRTRGYIPAYTCPGNHRVRGILALGRQCGLGAAIAVRRGALLGLGGIDEAFGPGGRFPSADDVDLELRFLLTGWHVYEVADVAVVHYGFRTLEEGKAHTVRDWSALGACLAKPIRAGRPVVVLLAAWLLVRRAILPAIADVVHLRKPKLRRLAAFAAGFGQGLRVPVERGTLKYRAVGPGGDRKVSPPGVTVF
jgi:glycosyltransferase involved in cell wall biosynthesis